LSDLLAQSEKKWKGRSSSETKEEKAQKWNQRNAVTRHSYGRRLKINFGSGYSLPGTKEMKRSRFHSSDTGEESANQPIL
jgi:hypothetical protein